MENQTVHVFVFDTLSDWEYGFAVAGIHCPMFQKNPGRFRVETVGLKKSPVTTMGGITILPSRTLDEIAPSQSAMLMLPGGMTWDQGKNAEALEKAKAFLDAGVPVAAICGATWGLAKVGILDDRCHTSNSPDYLKATGYRGESFYRSERAVTDRNVITAGGMAPLEFACHIFTRLDIFTAEKIDAWYALFKTGDISQYAILAR